MTTFHTEINIEANSWKNVHAALGLSAGASFKFQNTGGAVIRVVTSVGEPATDDGLGMAVNTGTGFYDCAPNDNEYLWAKGGLGVSGISHLTIQSGDPTITETDLVYSTRNPLPVDSVSLPLTAFGDLRVAELTPIYQLSFESTVTNTEIGEIATAGSGAVTQSDAMCVANTGTDTASVAKWVNAGNAKYRSGFGGLFRGTGLFTAGVAGTEQMIGLADTDGSSATHKNGYAVGFDGATFGFMRWQNDVLFTVPLTDWDDPLDGSGESQFTLDPTKLTVYFIQFRYLGGGAIKIWIEDTNTGSMILAHTVPYSGLYLVPSVYNPNFHLMVHALNKATTADLTVKSGSMSYFVEGKSNHSELQQPHFTTEKIQKTLVTTEVAIFTIRNKTSYAGKDNFIDLVLSSIGGSIEANSTNNLGSLRLVKNATLGGTPSYSDISTTNSIVEIDTSGTTVTGGKTLLVSPMAGKNDRIPDGNLTDYDIILSHGETITLAGFSENSATMNGNLLWKELF